MRLQQVSFLAAAPAVMALGVMACDSTSAMQEDRLPPPTPSVSASTLVLRPAGRTPALQVSARVWNETSEAMRVAVGPECPLFVRVFPDTTEEYQGSVDGSMACAPGTLTLLLAPGDTTVLTRVLTAAELAPHPPGTYGINVVVTTTAAIIGMWGGTIDLPL